MLPVQGKTVLNGFHVLSHHMSLSQDTGHRWEDFILYKLCFMNQVRASFMAQAYLPNNVFQFATEYTVYLMVTLYHVSMLRTSVPILILFYLNTRAE